MFRVQFGEQAFLLPPGESIIGRDATCQIQLNHRSVSRRHARILNLGGSLTIEDLSSRNGTFVNQSPVRAPQKLTSGSDVRVGTQSFSVVDEPMARLEDETEEVGAIEPAYRVPAMRSCIGCRHLIPGNDGRCRLCGTDQRRASEQALSVAAWTDPKGRRAARRVPVKLRGLYVSPTLTVECEISNLSLAGAFLRADLLDEPQTPCDLVVFVAKDDVVRLGGCVVRIEQVEQGDGMGIRFAELGPAATLWVSTVVALGEKS